MEYKSKYIIELENQLIESNDPERITENFWKYFETENYPIVEPLDEGKGFHPDQYELVTFLYRTSEEVENVFLLAELNYVDPRDYVFSHIRGTDIYYKSIPLPNNATIQYRIFVNDPLDGIFAGAKYENRWDRFHEYPDPLNKDVKGIENYFGPNKHLFHATLNPFGNEDPTWWSDNPNKGQVEEFDHESQILGYSRKVYIYTPHNYNPDISHKFLLVHDGGTFLRLVEVRQLLDNLIANRIIDPIVGIFVDPGKVDGNTKRYDEYPPNQGFVDYISNELLPWVRKRYSISENPHDGIVAGSSYGGMAAFWYGYSEPEKIRNVLTLSGSFHWGKDNEGYGYEWIPNQVAFSDTQPLQIYLEVGKLEGEYHPEVPEFPNQIVSHRHFCTILKMKKYEFTYFENNGDHSEASWRAAFKRGLLHFWKNCHLFLDNSTDYKAYIDAAQKKMDSIDRDPYHQGNESYES